MVVQRLANYINVQCICMHVYIVNTCKLHGNQVCIMFVSLIITHLKSSTVCTSSRRSLHLSMNELRVVKTGEFLGGQGHKVSPTCPPPEDLWSLF